MYWRMALPVEASDALAIGGHGGGGGIRCKVV